LYSIHSIISRADERVKQLRRVRVSLMTTSLTAALGLTPDQCLWTRSRCWRLSVRDERLRRERSNAGRNRREWPPTTPVRNKRMIGERNKRL